MQWGRCVWQAERHLQQAHLQTCNKHAGTPCIVVTQATQRQATVKQDILGAQLSAWAKCRCSS